MNHTEKAYRTYFIGFVSNFNTHYFTGPVKGTSLKTVVIRRALTQAVACAAGEARVWRVARCVALHVQRA